MSRQHAAPILVPTDGPALQLAAAEAEWSEATIQTLIQAHPACVPIREIDPLFADPVPLCTELNTPAGPIDNVFVTPSGLPVLVECKLWRNPQARREVIGQILDYAKELSRWTASDLQREVSRRTGRQGNAVLDLVREAGHAVDEIAFTDALTLNLRRGRMLLLIAGDGIREGVEAIAEYLQAHSGLHFTFGLVELPVYAMPDGSRLVAPRVLARTTLVIREVVSLPEGMVLRQPEETGAEATSSAIVSGDDAARIALMREVAAGLVLDDPDQPIPRVSPKGWLFLYMPAPASSCWVSVLFKRSPGQVGVRLTSNAGTVGEAAVASLAPDWQSIKEALGGTPQLHDMGGGRYRFQDFLAVNHEASAEEHARAVTWLQARVNDFVTVFRPRIRDAMEQLEDA